jgi:hypothetical protein
MLKALRRYIQTESIQKQDSEDLIKPICEGPTIRKLSPIIWKGTPDEYHKLLMVRKAELLLAEARLTGNPYIDWHTRNHIRDLEIKIADLRRLLKGATGEDSNSSDI